MQQPDLVQFQADLYWYRMAIQLRSDALAALIAMDAMIEHFEDMGFANTAHIIWFDKRPKPWTIGFNTNGVGCQRATMYHTKPSPSDRPGGPSDKTLLSPVREEAAEFSCALIWVDCHVCNEWCEKEIMIVNFVQLQFFDVRWLYVYCPTPCHWILKAAPTKKKASFVANSNKHGFRRSFSLVMNWSLNWEFVCINTTLFGYGFYPLFGKQVFVVCDPSMQFLTCLHQFTFICLYVPHSLS